MVHMAMIGALIMYVFCYSAIESGLLFDTISTFSLYILLAFMDDLVTWTHTLRMYVVCPFATESVI
jgi:hypothetical protein